MKLICKKELDTSSIEAFIINYFEEFAPETFYKDTGKIQCSGCCNRSIPDITALVNGTFDLDMTEEDVAMILVDLVKHESLEVLYCPDIDRLVFLEGSLDDWEEINNMDCVGVDGYCWEDLVTKYKKKYG